MHSRIYQLDKTAVNKEDYMEDFDIPEWFEQDVSDYVAETEDRNDDINWLKESLKTISGLRIENDILIIDDKDAVMKDYFTPRLAELKKTVGDLELDSFVEGFANYRIKRLLNDTYSFYVFMDGELYTLDAFFRHLSFGEQTVFHFGGTLDYHF